MTWREEVEKKFDEIRALKDDWDGAGAGPIGEDVTAFAMHVLDGIMRPTMPAPYVTPMSNGGLTLEWHIRGVDFEIEISESGSFAISFDIDECWTPS